MAFGGPLSGHQGVSFSLAEAATHLELARWHCYRVLWMRQHGIPCQREGAMAKWYTPKKPGAEGAATASAVNTCSV